MTVRETNNLLRGDRTPAYVDRGTGAAELLISPDTWDEWVKEGRLPQPCDTFPSGTPRWRWEDVEGKLGQLLTEREAQHYSTGVTTSRIIRSGGDTLPGM
jgi:hypothetical protein